MPDYYVNNAVYDELRRSGSRSFLWVAGNAWMLAYGDSECAPRVLVLARGRSAPEDRRAFAALAELGGTRLPVWEIVFDDNAPDIDRVQIRLREGDGFAQISLDDLRAEFLRAGLPTTNTATKKYLNDRVSSAYHRWQREALGASLTVSDLDLLRVQDGGILELVELKRSYIPLEKWSPYVDDYRNFTLLHNVAAAARVRFTIAYNLRAKNPFFDDPSRIAVFSYLPNRATRIGEVSFADFEGGAY